MNVTFRVRLYDTYFGRIIIFLKINFRKEIVSEINFYFTYNSS